MAWRVVSIENPAQLSLRDNRIVIKQDEEVSLPLEDIDTLLLDNYAISISANLLSELSRNKVTTILCDDKHLPASILVPFSQHSRQAKVSRAQLSITEPLRKNLWRNIVIQKINNQAKVLEKFDYIHESENLKSLAKTVRTDDSDNRESVAARSYFAILLDDATRRKPMWHNSALNYGYAIVRSSLAKSLAARGLVLSQGIFHHNELNSFNLVDDIIEPFRPAVDEYILKTVALRRIGDNDASLNRNDRAMILDILNQNVIINDRQFSTKIATDKVAENFAKTVQTGNLSDLILPSIREK